MNNFKKLALPVLITLPLNAFAAEPVKISGLMQIDASFGKDYADNSASDIILRKIELGLDSQINERTAMHILMEHEDGMSGMDVTEGNITLDLTNGWYLRGGRMVVPFGVFETNMITDTLTKAVGEAHEDALQIGYGGEEGLYGSLYAFNGDTIETSTFNKGDDTIGHFGASIGYLFKSSEMSLDIGADYISSMADADSLFDGLSLNTDSNGDAIGDTATLDSYVSGLALHGIYSNGSWSAVVEYLKADKFQVGELAFNGQGAEPSATNIEAAYSFDWGTLALSYQTMDETQALGLPESRVTVGAATDLFENTTLKVEYAQDDDYSTTVGGTGNDASNLTFQLATTF